MKTCPECNNEVDLSTEEVVDGETFYCGECGEELEVVFLDHGGYVLDLVSGGLEDDSSDPDDLDDPNPNPYGAAPKSAAIDKVYNCLRSLPRKR